MPVLIFETGPEKGRTVRLEEDRVYSLGRDPRADLCFEDELASRIHARLRGKDGRFFIKDEDSSNGTLVNDQRISPMAELKSGDKIAIGSTTLSFLSDDEAGGGAGRELGGYRLLQRLGRGGMGTVYRALQISLNREVALKLLAPQLSRDPAFVAQFHREARAAAQLNHPNIVQVYDVHQESGLTFYAMEFMPGGTVEDRINKGGCLPVDEALAFLLDAARGLQYAELKGIVHRDIKPDNLMLTELNAVKIADLGLAHGVDEGAATGIHGTPHFISPEQARGQPLDTRSDLYSLGATFFRMLTGRTMFHGERAEDIIRKQVKDPPPSVREVKPEVPERVAAIQARLVRKDPAERYQTCAELIADIEAVRAGGRKARHVVFAALLLVVCGGAAVYAFLQSRDQRDPNATSPTIIIENAADPAAAAEAERIRRELEVREREVASMRALSDLNGRRSSISREEYRDELVALAEKFPGTETARAVLRTVDELSAEIEADSARAAEREHSLSAAVQTLQERVKAALLEHRLASAARAVLERVGAAGEVAADPRVEQAAAEQQARVLSAAQEAAAQVATEVQDALAKADFPAAWLSQQSGLRMFEGTADLPEDAGELRTRLAELGDGVRQLGASIREAEAREHETALRADVALLRSEVDWKAHFDLIRRFRFNEARDRLESIVPRLATEEYRGYLAVPLADLGRAAQVFDAFVAAVREGRLQSASLRHPERGLNATIHGIAEDGSGIVVEVSRSLGSSRSVLEFSAFADAGRCIDLLGDRPLGGPERRLGVAACALLVVQAAWAQSMARLAGQLRTYDPAVGWNTARQVALTDLALTNPMDAQLVELLDAAANDPATAAEARELRDRLAREKAARDRFLKALDPFQNQNPTVRFAESARLLQALIEEYRDTAFFLAAYDVFDPGDNSMPLVAPQS